MPDGIPQLISYIAPAAPATRRPASGDEPFLRPEIGFTPAWFNPGHQCRNQVISGTIRTKSGAIIQACDAVWSGRGGTAVHLSSDGGRTCVDPGAGTPPPKSAAGLSGGTIAGIHAALVELGNGRLMALGRDFVDANQRLQAKLDARQ